MKFYKAIPRLENQRKLGLWHRSQEAQWSALQVDWSAPQRLVGKGSKDRLARILTPVLMAERSAFHAAMALMPFMGAEEDTESQYYLTTWLVDEARHAELFARMFDRLDREPTSPRRLPHAYLFQTRMKADEPALVMSGLLAAEVMAKHVMQEFRRLDVDDVLSEISDRILVDEARHLGFNRIYVEDRISMLTVNDPGEASAYSEDLSSFMESVLAGVPQLLESTGPELRELGFDFDTVLEEIGKESRSRLTGAIRAGQRSGSARDPS